MKKQMGIKIKTQKRDKDNEEKMKKKISKRNLTFPNRKRRLI